MFYVQLFRLKIPKAQKKTVNLSVFFALLGSASVKAARRKLMKLTPAINFINVKRKNFSYESLFFWQLF